MKRLVVTFTVVILLLGSSLGVLSATITVPDDYSTIQAAIDAAQPGDTVYVMAGEYRENLTIEKPVRLVGEDRTQVQIQAADDRRPTLLVTLKEGKVSLESFCATRAASGVYIDTAVGALVYVVEVLVSNNEIGIDACGEGSVSIARCLAVDNAVGIRLRTTRAEILETEICRGVMGVVLVGEGTIAMSRCLIVLAKRAICTSDCQLDSNQTCFKGLVEGEGNRVFGTQVDLCPEHPGAPWPKDFIDERWQRVASEIFAAYKQGVRAQEEEDYARACDAYLAGLALLSEQVEFPILEGYLYRDIAVAYRHTGQYENAFSAYHSAHSIFLERDITRLSETLHVPREYPTIQTAVDAAYPRDTVYIESGWYVENVTVRKSLRLLGESRQSVHIWATDSGEPVLSVSITVGTAWISGLSLEGGEWGLSISVGEGVLLAGGTVMVEDLLVTENNLGISTAGPGFVSIKDALVFGNHVGVTANAGRTELFGVEIGGGSDNLSALGLLISGEGVTEVQSCTIGLVPRACEVATPACGWNETSWSFSGNVYGERNHVLASDMYGFVKSGAGFCPESKDSLWLDSFLDETWRITAEHICRLYHLGVANIGAREFVNARRSFLEALAGFGEGFQLWLLEAMIWKGLAQAESHLGNNQAAIDDYEAASTIFGDHGLYAEQAIIAAKKGWVALDQGLYQQALKHFAAARIEFERRSLERDFSYVELGLGHAYLELSRYEQALKSYSTARTTLLSQGEVTKAILILRDVANVYTELGLFERALEAFAKVEEQLEGLLHPLGESRIVIVNLGIEDSLAHTRWQMGFLYSSLGMLDKARALLSFARDVFALRANRLYVARVDVGLGNLLLKEGEWKEALAYYEAARLTFAELDQQFDVIAVDLNTGTVYWALGQYEKALAKYETSLEILDAIPPLGGMLFSYPSARWMIHNNKGLVHESLDESDEAAAAYERAIAVIESIRGEITSEELKLAWQERTQDVYERLIDLLYRMGEGASAFQYAERCRARTFLDLLAMGPVGTIENVAEEGIRSGVVETSVIKKDLAEVVAGLPEDTAALEYFITENAVYLWVVTQDGVSEPIPIEIGREVLINHIVSFRKMLETPPTGGGTTASFALLSAARDLFDLLIGPVEEKIAGFSHLVIVPSGTLYYLPFSALYRCPGCAGRDLNGGEFLVERFALSYAPSLTTLKYAQAIGAQIYPERTFLGLADPDSGDPTIHRLPDAQREAESIAALFLRSEVYVDRQATEEVVQSYSATAREILFSTHGHFNPLNPMFSYLLLSPTGKNDGKLHAHEIFSLPLRANMVVLSACETLLPSLAQMTDQLNKIARRAGDDTPQELTENQLKTLTAGDEVVGLTRAFISAGASSVLSSLWSVPSGSTAALMVAFYGHLNEGLNKAEALRRAQMDVKEVYPHPWYWAAFNLMGDWR